MRVVDLGDIALEHQYRIGIKEAFQGLHLQLLVLQQSHVNSITAVSTGILRGQQFGKQFQV